MTRFQTSRTTAMGMMLGVLLASPPLAFGDDSKDKPRQVISTFAVTGMI